MKNIVIQDKGNSKFKLTVTPTEVRIKLQEDSSPAMIAEVGDFLKEVANSPEMLNCTRTWRGQVQIKDGVFIRKIIMHTETKHKENRQSIKFGYE